jgi:putative ABC transport system permease protein
MRGRRWFSEVRRGWFTISLRLRSIFRQSAVERDLHDELEDHVVRETERQQARGLEAAPARAAALRQFGGVEAAKEQCRDARRVGIVETVRQDARYALRVLRRAPGYTATATLTLALGIGATTAVVSVVDAVLVAPLPYPAPDRLVDVRGTWPRGGVAALAAQTTAADVAAYADGRAFNLRTDAETVRVRGALVSAELFAVLGARPTLGRPLQAGENVPGRDRVVVVSEGLWRARLGADPASVGRTLEIDGMPRTVIGVMPASFVFPSRDTALWVPYALDPSDITATWAGDFMPLVGRLRPHATIEQLQAEVRLLQPRVAAAFPWRMPEDWNRDVGVVPLRTGMASNVRARLLVLLAAVALVLLIACANVANLTLARGATRTHELGVRAALGASPRRLARQLLTESVVLAAIGGGIGFLLAVQGLALLSLVLPADTPRLDEVRLNWRVLAYGGALTLATGCLCGLAPVRALLGRRLAPAMGRGGRGGSRGLASGLRHALTVAQISCAVLLLIGALLLTRGLWTLSQVDPGFRAERVVTARVAPNRSICGDAERCLAFYRTLDVRLRATPGVTHAGFVNTLPLRGAVAKRSLALEGFERAAGETVPLFWLNVITPAYVDAMRIQIVAGRGFVEADGAGGSRVALITAATAHRFWPDGSAVGRRVRFVGETEWRTIVGIVGDVRAFDLERAVPSYMDGVIYVPMGPHATLEDGTLPSEMTMVLQTREDASNVSGRVRALVAEVTREAAVSDVEPMGDVVSDAVAAPAATAALVGAFALLAVTLGSLGVYGVLSFAVSTLTREIGVRMALGAQRRDISWLVLREGLKVAVIGLTLGTAGAMVSMRWLASELHGVSPFDPAAYALVIVLVALVTLAACVVPARRAMSIDPLTALRD